MSTVVAEEADVELAGERLVILPRKRRTTLSWTRHLTPRRRRPDISISSLLRLRRISHLPLLLQLPLLFLLPSNALLFFATLPCCLVISHSSLSLPFTILYKVCSSTQQKLTVRPEGETSDFPKPSSTCFLSSSNLLFSGKCLGPLTTVAVNTVGLLPPSRAAYCALPTPLSYLDSHHQPPLTDRHPTPSPEEAHPQLL